MNKEKRQRKVMKWIIRIFIVFVLIVALDITILAYPQMLFDYKFDYGSNSYYSDKVFSPELIEKLHETDLRLKDVEIYDRLYEFDVFICQDQSTYNIIARLAMIPTNIPGFNLSFLNNSYVSVPRINEMKRKDGFPQYSVFEGDLAHGITHEIIHDLTEERLGFFNRYKMKRWKSEGYAEYNASRFHSRQDSTSTLADRINIIKNHYNLTDHVREYFMWRTMIEYLQEVEQYDFEQIIDDSVTVDKTYDKMMTWYDNL